MVDLGHPFDCGGAKLHNVSEVGELMHLFTLKWLTFKLVFHCFDTIIAMICVSNNNHFSCVIPPRFVSNNVTAVL
jgi:hypothetical protein